MSGIRKSHRPHEGELLVQARRHAPPAQSAELPQIIREHMSRQHADYYRALQYLPLGTIDAAGRPWATVLCNPETEVLGSEILQVEARVNPACPFVRAVCSPTPSPRRFAGVGIVFSTRSRIKLGGVVDAATLAGERLALRLHTNEHMGNCPKYITARQLQRTARTPRTTALGPRLSLRARELLQRASTAFIATRHDDREAQESDLGFNHRGGPRGFLRFFEDEQGTYLVLPDYSGNRFYQSLGNVETDPVMGVAVPDFTTGDLLQITGRARNLFDAEAARVLPGSELVTLITIDEAVMTEGALDLELVGDEQLSPYNPVLRVLAREQPGDRQPLAMAATLVDIVAESSTISTFTFALPEPVDTVPGGHAIFDFSDQFHRRYQHMNAEDPRSLNDDYVRTFTISRISPDRRRISITVKKAGVISSYLHSLSLRRGATLALPLRGVGGTFTCFEPGRPVAPMVWIAAGTGITPFLAMYRALRSASGPMPEIELFYACKADEVALIDEMTDIRVHVFVSHDAPTNRATDLRDIQSRRLHAADFADQARLDRATVFVCGPSRFMADVRTWLEGRVAPARLRFESFAF